MVPAAALSTATAQVSSLTTFPIQADDDGDQSPAFWTPLAHTIKLESYERQSDEQDVKKYVHQAHAALLWAYTGEEVVSFVAGTSTADGIQDLAVHNYEVSMTEGLETQWSRCLKEKQRTAIDMLVSGGSILLQTTSGNADSEKSRNDIESMTLERTPLRMVYSANSSIGCIDMVAWFDRRCLSTFHVERYFQHLISNISSAWQTRGLTELQIEEVTLPDKEFIHTWNGKPQELVDRCIHDCVAERATEDGTKIAIDAWDGRMTRAELEEAASSLAMILVQAAVQPRGVVAILLEKSMWGIVAMLAVNKAGAGFILLDPSLPAERLKIMANQLSTTHVITTKNHMTVACTLASIVVTHSGGGDFRVTDTESTCQKQSTSNKLPLVSPTDSAFYIFTSGSSGIPKAIIISHNAWVTTCGEGYQYGIDKSSRVLQYASCSFVVAILDITVTLIAGGTLLIPGKEERMNDLSGAIRRLWPNYICMTPSVAKILEPHEVPSIQTLVLVGEPIPSALGRKWLAVDTVTLRNGYGQSEACSMNSTAVLNNDTSFRSIGRSSWLNYWIVDPADHNRLMPVGGVGELLLEGYSIAQGYLG